MAKKENITLDDLQEQVRTYIFNEDDLNKIEKAIQYSEEKHAGQLRKSGELYFTHLVNVAYILSTLHVSPVTIIAGLLQDRKSVV